jgi:hypothetical protein
MAHDHEVGCWDTAKRPVAINRMVGPVEYVATDKPKAEGFEGVERQGAHPLPVGHLLSGFGFG